MMNRRIIMRVELHPKSKDRLNEFCDRTGMTKVAAVSRLIDWFCRQSDSIQAMIQGLIPPAVESDTALMILKKYAQKK
jgi:hypothetical protein